MKSYKIFISVFLLIMLVALGSVAGFNYYIDPLWTFDHENDSNTSQTVIDERQQKVNHIHFTDFDYDTLLVGSSRTTYINQNDFAGMYAYNFAVSDLSFQEYIPMIDFAKSEKGRDFETIIIGVDFFKSSIAQSTNIASFKPYIDNVEAPFYRWKNLISTDVLDYSKRNYKLSKAGKPLELRNYNRDNIAVAMDFDTATRQKNIAEKIYKFKTSFYGASYVYNPDFKKVLAQIKRENPKTKIIIFTTPISTELFNTLIEAGNLADYKQWLKDIVDVNGSVYNFMYPNQVTNNLDNYFDGHHFYPQVGTEIAKVISNQKVEVDFGMYLTKANFTAEMARIDALSR